MLKIKKKQKVEIHINAHIEFNGVVSVHVEKIADNYK